MISVISADGHFRIFDLQQQQYEAVMESSGGSRASSHSAPSSSSSSEEVGESKTIKPCFYQRLPPNIKQAQIAGKTSTFSESRVSLFHFAPFSRCQWGWLE